QIPGLNFAHYGQRLGYRLLAQGSLAGLNYIVNPVSITRYFEFAFALDSLPEEPGSSLDVSSPRLFSYYVVEKNLAKLVKVINPAPRDAAVTERVAKRLHMKNIAVVCKDVKQELMDGK